MDDDRTLEFPPPRQTQPAHDDEATQKLRPLNRERLATGGQSTAHSYPATAWQTPEPLPASASSLRARAPWPSWKRLLLSCLLLLLLIAGGGLAYGYYYFQANIQAPLSQFIHTVSRGQDEPAGSVIPPDSSVTGRVWNILLLGSDNDGKYSFPALLTQVIMIVHVDTIQNSVTLVSIPRDSWVYVPEVGSMHKIDQAFLLGASPHSSFDSGVRLARLTVEQDYGITIDRYAWVGLGGFSRVIDTLGGIDINVTHPIVDDVYPDDTGAHASNPYAYTRLYLAPGPQHLNGQQALEFVRSRHADLVGDIGRTQRQQQVLEALKLKLNVGRVLGNLQHLFSDLKGSVYTDFSEQELFGFAGYGHGLPGNAIAHVTLGPGSGSHDYGDYGTVYDPSAGGNQDVVIPHCATIQPEMSRIFNQGGFLNCNVSGP